MSYHYAHPRPALTVEPVVLAIGDDGESLVLLIKRSDEPFAGDWAIPGGRVEGGEALEVAARRQLRTEVGIEADIIEQIEAFGDPGRDPQDWVVSVVFATVVDRNLVSLPPGHDARTVAWFPLSALPPAMAFDHRAILGEVCARIGESLSPAEPEMLVMAAGT